MVSKKKWILMAGLMLVLYATSCSKDDSSTEPGKESNQPIREITTASSAYADTVFSFMPAPGQFINTDYTDIIKDSKMIQNKTISLGAWGGQIVLGFDHTVLNKKGNDIQVEGSGAENAAEPGVVWVMYDTNGNGRPDDTWYELKGSAYGKEGYERNYSVTYYKPDSKSADVMWVDKYGDTGYVKSNKYHDQSYYPSWITADSYTLEGSLLPDSGIDDTNPAYITSTPFEYGYADNHTATNGGNPLDIMNAVDAKGNAVDLIGIDFIKIQTGIQKDLGWLGEFSTEVSSISDLHML
jgi:hypothetical protein